MLQQATDASPGGDVRAVTSYVVHDGVAHGVLHADYYEQETAEALASMSVICATSS